MRRIELIKKGILYCLVNHSQERRKEKDKQEKEKHCDGVKTKRWEEGGTDNGKGIRVKYKYNSESGKKKDDNTQNKRLRHKAGQRQVCALT